MTVKKTGFMSEETSVPDDFDQMGAKAITALFEGTDKEVATGRSKLTTEELKTHIATYCASRPEIVACYLFGSRAACKERTGSDVDLAFLLDRSVPVTAYFDSKMTYLVGLGSLLRLDIHPLIMNDAGEVVLDQILRKGLPVYGGDSLECIRFRMFQASLIAEFNPLRDRMEKLLFQKYKEEPVYG